MLNFNILEWRLFAGRSLVLIMASVFLVAIASCNQSAPANKEVILATTTSTYDTGLLDVLVPAFQKKTGYVVTPLNLNSAVANSLNETVFRSQADLVYKF